MTQLRAATALLLLSSLCCSDATDAANTPNPRATPATVSVSRSNTTKISVWISNTTNGATEPPAGTPPNGTARTGTPGLPRVASLAGGASTESTTHAVIQNKSVITEETVMNSSLSRLHPTLPSSPSTTENQNSINTTAISVSTQQRDPPPPEATVVTSTPTASEKVPWLQGSGDGKDASSSAPSSSYSSIILPVVIVLIVITLSVFILVGLYQMCWKKDAGTTEDGSDQPQSNKESVKLLTVKTISQESGEHCVTDKTKNCMCEESTYTGQ